MRGLGESYDVILRLAKERRQLSGRSDDRAYLPQGRAISPHPVSVARDICHGKR
jgi:hypothetical protein